ncbi:MAG: hypothetical protein ABJJ05_07860 [Maribacter litoralis]|uniref:hypothetical protein n=1 Tax=Maribacter litoralis TaxID=2059726 RepID=UPI0032988185
MKNLKLLLVFVFALGIGTVTAHEKVNNEDKGAKWITTQIYEMLADEEIPDQIRGARAEIKIALADDGVYRLLSIKTNNKHLKDFIKTGIDFENLEPGDKDLVYVVPIEIAE